MAEAARPGDIDYLAGLVREHDRPRYFSTLFAPSTHRADLLALYGFAAEIARIPDLVSESALGEIRLKWWQDSLAEALDRGGESGSPAIRAIVAAMIRHSLPQAPFDALVAARSLDLYSDPPASVQDVEGRLGETESALFQLAAIVGGARTQDTADAAGHAGIAYGLARRLAAFAAERARGRTILPTDILAAEGVPAREIFAAPPAAGIHNAIRSTTEVARAHLRDARKRIDELPPGIRYIFLPLLVVEPLLARVEKRGAAILTQPVGLSDLEMLMQIAAARLTGTRLRRRPT